jgi:lysine 2,3-aminomutase
MQRLDAIPHVKVIRFHTRVPIVAPERISNELIEVLDRQKAVYVVLHCNHSQEISNESRAVCRKLAKSGIVMLSQTVLLRDVNDTVEDLTELFKELVAIRVKPYYLHHADLAKGTSHFRTSFNVGQTLMREIRGVISGLCQPTYVLDIPGGHGKVPIGPTYLRGDARRGWTVEDPWGHQHDCSSSGAEL